MKHLYLLILFLGLPLWSLAQSPKSVKDIVKEKMLAQQDAWNEGDFDGYMSFYYKGDETIYMSSKSTLVGYSEIYEIFRKSYPDKESMGKLNFTLNEFIVFDNYCFLTGRWQVENDGLIRGGIFSLNWAKFDNEWYIISDHTTLVE